MGGWSPTKSSWLEWKCNLRRTTYLQHSEAIATVSVLENVPIADVKLQSDRWEQAQHLWQGVPQGGSAGEVKERGDEAV